MRVLATIILATFIVTPASGLAEELRATIEFDTPISEVSAIGEVLQIPGTQLLARPGAPLLPYKTIYFVLPYGHEPLDIHLENMQVEPLDGVHNIAPAQLPMRLDRKEHSRITPPDPEIYGCDDPQPGEWIEAGTLQFKHGYALLPVTLHPLSFQPLSGTIDQLLSAEIVVTTKPAGTISRFFRARSLDRELVKTRALETTALATYPSAPPRGPLRLDPGDYPYLIVTPEVFIDLGGDNSLEALRDYREADGLAANIVTLEWIRENYTGTRPDGGQDDATRIRDFLSDAYLEWNTSYVLLVGDADSADVGGESGDDLLQVRKFWVDTGNPDAVGDMIPSDLYYTCLDGTFDDDADGIYGEHGDGPAGGEVDLMAELYVGRAPADSAAEVQNFVAKTLAYERAAGAWLKKVLMVGELLWDEPSNIWGADSMDKIIEGDDSGGYSTLGFDSLPFFECETLYDRSSGQANAWGSTELMPLLDDSPHIVNHLGHSNVTYNMRLMNWDADELINFHPFLLYTQGCLPGSFDNESSADEGNFVYNADCIAEHFVMGPHGAFAAVVNARYGWGVLIGTNSPSQRFHRQYWDAIFGEGMSTIGQALIDSKEDNASAFSDDYIRWVGFESNLLGDPAVAIKKSLNTDSPLLGLYPPALRFVGLMGGEQPAAAVLHVRNDGVDSLTFSATADQDWVTVTPASGSAPLDIEVSVDTSGLQAGTHLAMITISSPEADNSPVTLPIEFVLVETTEMQVPHIDSAPTVDGIISAGEYDQALSLPIDPEGSGEVTLHIAVAGNNLHVAVDDNLDRVEDDFDRLALMFDRDLDGVWPTESSDEGQYVVVGMMGGMSIFMPVYNPGNGYVMDMQNMEMNPPYFSGSLNMVDNHRVYEISVDLDNSNLNVGPAGTFGMLLNTTNSVQLGAGTVTGNWPAVVPEFDDQLFFGRVDLTPEGPWLYSEPRQLSFEAVPGRAAPDPAILSVFDIQGGQLDFTAVSNADWLVIDATGQTPQDMTVTIDHDGLAIDSYLGEIVFESAQADNVTHRVQVRLDVLPTPALLTVTPASFDIQAADDAPDPVLELNISNQGGRPMPFSVTIADGWLTSPRSFGTVNPGESILAEFTAGVLYLMRGTHQTEITIEAPDAEGSPVIVPVQVEVVGPTEVPPVQILNLEAYAAEIRLNWQMPQAAIVSGVMIRRAENVAPADATAGVEVYDGVAEELVDSGLTNGVTYCYSAFAHDAAGRYAAPASGCRTPGENQPPPIPAHLSPVDQSITESVPQLIALTVIDPQGSPVSYSFQLLAETTDDVLEEGAGTVTGNQVTWTPSLALEPGGLYRWRVQATDDRNAASAYSQPWTFALAGETGSGGCGCSHTGDRSAVWLLLGLLGLLLRRRP
jgi:MYXO-CTERM domain-containing protein